MTLNMGVVQSLNAKYYSCKVVKTADPYESEHHHLKIVNGMIYCRVYLIRACFIQSHLS